MKKFFSIFLYIILSGYFTHAQTVIDKSFTVNTTLTVANSPYLVTSSVDVNSGVILTIEEGVEIRFNSGLYIQVYGIMNAKGAKFTANTSTTKGFWAGIYVAYESGTAVGEINLENCIVEYAKNIWVRKGRLRLINSTITDFSDYGVQLYSQGILDIDNSIIKNTNYPITVIGDGQLIVGNNVQFTNNTNNYIYLNFSDINKNFYLPNFQIPYRTGNLQVNESGTLHVSPGVHLQFANSSLTIKGKIKAKGTINQPIIFDRYNTNNFYGININATSIDTACIFKHCIFKNANYNEEIHTALDINNASPTIENCNFSGNVRNVLITGISKPVFTNCVFKPSTLETDDCYNFIMDLNANPILTNDSIYFNRFETRAIKLRSSTIIDDAHLKKLKFENLDNPTYCLYDETIVHDTASLVIDAGVVIKCRNYNSLITARGTITGIGTVEEPIVFTSISDDIFGNPLDSQNNGTSAISSSSSGRIMLNSVDISKLENWKIHYGGYNSRNWVIEMKNNNIVKNCEIKNSYRAIKFQDNVQILNNSFVDINYFALGRHLTSGNPVLLANTFSNVEYIGIYISGIGNESLTLKSYDLADQENVAYLVEYELTIPNGSVITIDPGVVVKFFYDASISVNGGIKAIGKSDKKIIFTSIDDDSASGDSNNNGTDTSPDSGDWSGIEFKESASDTENILKNCEFRYCGSTSYGAIGMWDCRIEMDSIKVTYSYYSALGIFGTSNPILSNSELFNIESAPIYMDMFSNPTFNKNKVANVERIGLLIHGQTINGTIPLRSFAGYDNITYIIDENMTVDNHLIFSAGLTFKGSGKWNIKGKLEIQGTTTNPVVFTTIQDDVYGNPKDIEQNGTTTLSNQGSYFYFYDESNDLSSIEYALFRYSSAIPIQTNNASPKILNTTFHNINYEGISLSGTSKPSINGCIFNNVKFPFRTSLVTYPVETNNNTMSGTTGRGIKVTDETLNTNITLEKRSFAGMPNIPYIFGDYKVGNGAKLTINPGIVCKFLSGGILRVYNGLIARGGVSNDEAIVFTADLDDFYGGDTYGDGDSKLPQTKSYWSGIYFYNESIDENCVLENCILKYSGYYYRWGSPTHLGAISIDNSSPRLSNCLFENNTYGIITYNTSLPNITNCDFVGTDPSGYAILNQTATNTVSAANCWWNSNTGPKHTSNPNGTGERVSDYVVFSPWAQQLAKPVLGDVSMNGEVKPYDASLVLQHAVSSIVLSAKQQGVADVSGNGIISSFDASLILQYCIGLISRFDQSGLKSAENNEHILVSFPDIINANEKKNFEIPLTITTDKGIKALDMKFRINQDHVKFLRVNREKLPAGFNLEVGIDSDTGEFSLSLASAYDLGLINQQFLLEFEFSDSRMSQSIFSLNSAMANDYFIQFSRTAIISGKSDITSANYQSLLTEPFVFADRNGIHTRFEFSKSSQNLTIQVYDLKGRLLGMKTFMNLSSGVQHIDLLTSDFETTDSGIYILKFKTKELIYTKKLLIK